MTALKEIPGKTTPGTIMQRLIDGLAFRYATATDGLTDIEIDFRPVDTSMSIDEVNHHILQLVLLTGESLGIAYEVEKDTLIFSRVRDHILQALEKISILLENLDDQELEKCTVYLKRTSTTYPFWYLINGFISDALTHVGQINSWRRMAGNPVAKISPFTGMAF